MNKKFLLPLVLLIVLSTAVSAASPFSTIGRGLESLMNRQFTIPHIGEGGERVSVLAFMLTFILLSAAFFALSTWEGNRLPFLRANKRVALVFSITLALLSILSTTVVEWFMDLLKYSFWVVVFGAVLALIVLVIFMLNSAVDKAASSLAGLGKIASGAVKGVAKLNKGIKEISDDIKGTLKSAKGNAEKMKNKIDSITKDSLVSASAYASYVDEAVANIPVFSEERLGKGVVVGLFSSRGNVHGRVFDEADDGRALLRQTGDNLRELRRKYAELGFAEFSVANDLFKKLRSALTNYSAKPDEFIRADLEKFKKDGAGLLKTMSDSGTALASALKDFLDESCRNVELLASNPSPKNIADVRVSVGRSAEDILNQVVGVIGNAKKIESLIDELTARIEEVEKEEAKKEKREKSDEEKNRKEEKKQRKIRRAEESKRQIDLLEKMAKGLDDLKNNK